jgi:hypothetical protein
LLLLLRWLLLILILRVIVVCFGVSVRIRIVHVHIVCPVACTICTRCEVVFGDSRGIKVRSVLLTLSICGRGGKRAVMSLLQAKMGDMSDYADEEGKCAYNRSSSIPPF